MLLHAPRFSKYLHGAAGLFPDTVEKMPYWFLHNTDGTMSPASWEEMADESDEFYNKVQACLVTVQPAAAPYCLSSIQCMLSQYRS